MWTISNVEKKMVWRQACLEQADLILLRWIKWRLKKGVLTDSECATLILSLKNFGRKCTLIKKRNVNKIFTRNAVSLVLHFNYTVFVHCHRQTVVKQEGSKRKRLKTTFLCLDGNNRGAKGAKQGSWSQLTYRYKKVLEQRSSHFSWQYQPTLTEL